MMVVMNFGFLILLFGGFLTVKGQKTTGQRLCDLPDDVQNGQLDLLDYESFMDYRNRTIPQNKANVGERIRVVCDFGYKLQSGSDGSVTCHSTGFWVPRLPACVPDLGVTKSPTGSCRRPVIQHGFITRSGRIIEGDVPVNHSVDVSCNLGYRIIGDVLLHCQPDGQWKGKIAVCLPAEIPKGGANCSSPYVQHGIVRHGLQDLQAGSQIPSGQELAIGCEPRYFRAGEKYIRCLNNGSWNLPVPRCLIDPTEPPKILACPLSNIQHGAFLPAADEYDYGNYNEQGAPTSSSPTEILVGSKAEVKCDSGYKIRGPSTVECHHNGSLSAVPVCEPIKQSCQLPHIQNGNYVSMSKVGELSVGSTIQVSCYQGYKMLGSSSVQCQPGNSLTNPPICVKKSDGSANSCRVPAVTDGIFRRAGVLVNPGDVIPSGVEIDVGCRAGRRRIGQRYLKCLGNETWDNRTPECKRESGFRPCDPLRSIPNGNYKEETADPGDYDYYGGGGPSASTPTLPTLYPGMSTLVDCYEGYKLIGSSNVTCNADRTLSPIPTCKLILCHVQQLLHGAVKQGNSTASSQVPYNTTISNTCDRGYHLIGMDRLTCGLTETFDEVFPTCRNTSEICTIPAVENGRTARFRSGLKVLRNASLKILCETGYNLDISDDVIKCEQNGIWSPKIPKCLIAQCDVPSIQDGTGMLVSGGPAPPKVAYSQNVSIQCDQGFRPIPNDVVLFCKENGKFSANIPHCAVEDRTSCRILLMLDNNTVIHSQGQNFISAGETVKMSCKNGFIPRTGRDELNCDMGLWRQEKPVCVKDNKCIIPTISHGTVTRLVYRQNHPNSILVNDTAKVQCNLGYIIQGSRIITCIDAQTFSQLPVCKPDVTDANCMLPDAGTGKFLNKKSNESLPADAWLISGSRIIIECPKVEEVINKTSEFVCLSSGDWDPPPIKCRQASKATDPSDNRGVGGFTLFFGLGILFLLIIMGVIVGVVLIYRRKKREKTQAGVQLLGNTMSNMVYMSSLEASNGTSGIPNAGLSLDDDDDVRPREKRPKVFKRFDSNAPKRPSLIKDSDDTGYERPASVATLRPAYRESKIEFGTEEVEEE